MVDITFNGMTMEFDIVSGLMDADIRLAVMRELGECAEQELLDAYLKAHEEKHGSKFLQSVLCY